MDAKHHVFSIPFLVLIGQGRQRLGIKKVIVVFVISEDKTKPWLQFVHFTSVRSVQDGICALGKAHNYALHPV